MRDKIIRYFLWLIVFFMIFVVIIPPIGFFIRTIYEAWCSSTNIRYERYHLKQDTEEPITVTCAYINPDEILFLDFFKGPEHYDYAFPSSYRTIYGVTTHDKIEPYSITENVPNNEYNYYETYYDPSVGDMYNFMVKIRNKKRAKIKISKDVLINYIRSKNIKEYNLNSLKKFAKDSVIIFKSEDYN